MKKMFDFLGDSAKEVAFVLVRKIVEIDDNGKRSIFFQKKELLERIFEFIKERYSKEVRKKIEEESLKNSVFFEMVIVSANGKEKHYDLNHVWYFDYDYYVFYKSLQKILNTKQIYNANRFLGSIFRQWNNDGWCITKKLKKNGFEEYKEKIEKLLIEFVFKEKNIKLSPFDDISHSFITFLYNIDSESLFIEASKKLIEIYKENPILEKKLFIKDLIRVWDEKGVKDQGVLDFFENF